tara:strand:+ start:186 stop:1316 length:1131 start_codon:yes stop_codon:yes gene_type:complete
LVKLLCFVVVFSLVDFGLAEDLIKADRPKVRVRADATVQSLQIDELGFGEVVTKVGEKDEWFEIILLNGTTGWVNSYLMVGVTQSSSAEIDTGSQLNIIPEKVKTVPLKSEEKERIDPYTEGLVHKKKNDSRRALSYFEQVLDDDPEHTKSLLHAAQAHIELEEFQEARKKLYKALEHGEGAFELARLYQGLGWPDSARKYSEIAQGEDGILPNPASQKRSGDEPVVLREWYIISIALGTSFVGILCLILLIRKQRRGRLFSRFSSAMNDASFTTDSVDGEIRELDRRIAERREALRSNSEVFSKNSGLESDEKDLTNSVNLQLKTLLNMLDAQDERTEIYEELNRLQMEKIKEMEREIDLLREGLNIKIDRQPRR